MSYLNLFGLWIDVDVLIAEGLLSISPSFDVGLLK